VSEPRAPLLAGGARLVAALPLAVAPLLVLVNARGGGALLAKPLHETLGPPLLAAAALAWLAARIRGGEPVATWLLACSLLLLAREINFEGADVAFLIAALRMAAWAWEWRARLLSSARTLPLRGVLAAAPVAYAISLVCDLRPLRIQTGGLHRVALEEPMETVGHLLLLAAGLAAALLARRAPRAGPAA
jgi:hypothetical protein